MINASTFLDILVVKIGASLGLVAGKLARYEEEDDDDGVSDDEHGSRGDERESPEILTGKFER